MLSALLVATLWQTSDPVGLERKALAQLPISRRARAISELGDGYFVTFTYDQEWATYARGSDLYPQKFVANDIGWLDIWKAAQGQLNQVGTRKVGNVTPGWDRFPAFFKRPTDSTGAVFIAEPPSASVPLLEIVSVSLQKPHFVTVYKGLGSFTSARTTPHSISVFFKKFVINRKQFNDVSRRHSAIPRSATVQFRPD